jgi:hypothetical protein
MNTPAPLACTLSAADYASRRDRWVALASRGLRESRSTKTGMRLRFQALPGVLAELDYLAAHERECCAFAQWSVRPERDDVILDVTAEGDGIAVVQAMFAGPANRSTASQRS